MRAVTKPWMEVAVRYSKTNEEGVDKLVTEKFIVSADTFQAAENIILGKVADMGTDIEIRSMARPAFTEVILTDEVVDEKFYAAKISFITIDEKTLKEKSTKTAYLVQANSLNGAIRNIDKVMKDSMLDYDSISVSETPVVDVFEE